MVTFNISDHIATTAFSGDGSDKSDISTPEPRK